MHSKTCSQSFKYGTTNRLGVIQKERWQPGAVKKPTISLVETYSSWIFTCSGYPNFHHY